jgi:pathogenesis-related protein 1
VPDSHRLPDHPSKELWLSRLRLARTAARIEPCTTHMRACQSRRDNAMIFRERGFMQRLGVLAVLASIAACHGTITSAADDEPPGGGTADARTYDASGGGSGTADAKPGPDAKPSPDAPAGGAGEPPELAGILKAHNDARAQVGVAALTWDPDLAAIATAWVMTCTDKDGDGLVDHNPDRSKTYPTYVGENIYASTGKATGPDAVSSWVDEAKDYDYASNTCAAGKVCGHYTQVVWRATEKVGCALYSCAGLTYKSTIVCDYGPGGNTGGKPY